MPARHKTAPKRWVGAVVLAAALLLASPLVASAWAQGDEETETETEASDGVSDDTLVEGARVYSATCSSCHQPRGAGISGQFPPLIDNPSVSDTSYLVDVIENGLEGEIDVLGVGYDGRMPAFSTLDPQEVDALVGYIQSGFASPAPPASTAADAEDGGTPGWFIPTLAAVVVIGLVLLSPRIVAANDRLEIGWLDAAAKTALIVILFIVFTVFVPSWAVETKTVAKLDEVYQQLIGTGIWLAGLGGLLSLLWFAHREDRV